MADTVIGARTRIEGTVTGADRLVVHGEVSGTVAVDGAVVVEADGVDGYLVGRKKVEILPDGRLVGDVRTARILISDGAVFRGRVDMDIGEG